MLWSSTRDTNLSAVEPLARYAEEYDVVTSQNGP